MSYMARAPAQQVLKNSQRVNKLHIPNSSYLKSFKKTMNIHNTTNVRNKQSQQSSYVVDQNQRPISTKHRQKSPTPNINIEKNKNNQFQQLQFMMQETDNSMQQLLNSSINQFEKLIIHEDSGESLQQQNYRLKNALTKMKTILKDKLQTALQKQKQQLSKMLQDYISLITKLLQDKQQLTIKIQDIVEDNQKKVRQMQKQFNLKLKSVSQQRDQQITSTKSQIQQFLNIIQQYQEQAKSEQIKFNEMQQKIQQLEFQKQHLLERLANQVVLNRSYNQQHSNQHQHQQQCSLRIQAQSTKIQTLLQLLEKTQHENNGLKVQINQLRTKQNSPANTINIKQIKQAYQKRIQQIQQQHQQQFLQYQKAIRDTLLKKDQCIQRLNLIIEGLRERKAVH